MKTLAVAAIIALVASGMVATAGHMEDQHDALAAIMARDAARVKAATDVAKANDALWQLGLVIRDSGARDMIFDALRR